MSLSPPSSPSSSSAAALTATIASPSPIAALPAPNANPNPNSSNRRPPPPCWTNEETLALIDSYREKWYSLRRANLRAAHWDEVAVAVARRCTDMPGATPKTSLQCRHKIEKLRKRYRSERQRSLNHDPTALPSSHWIFFKNMDQMENPNPNPRHQKNHYREVDSDYDDEEIDEIGPPLYRRPQIASNGSGGGSLKFKIPKAVRSSRAIPLGIPSSIHNPNSNPSFASYMKPGLEEARRRVEAKRRREEEEESDSGGTMSEIVRALRVLGDGYVRMEQMKMDMAREMERMRMEMELKRTEMILDTQSRIVDSFLKGFLGQKKVKCVFDGVYKWEDDRREDDFICRERVYFKLLLYCLFLHQGIKSLTV